MAAKLLVENWKNYIIQEQNRIPQKRISVEIVEKIFKYFHVSRRKLHAERFVFNPRVPKNPMDAEDDFTDRISLGMEIKASIDAAGHWTRDDLYVYAGDLVEIQIDDIDIYDLQNRHPKCPSSKDNPYGESFSFRQWLLSLSEGEKRLVTRYYGISPELMDQYLKARWDEAFAIRTKLEKQGGKAKQFIEMIYGKPKLLPPKLKEKFYGCVPDAMETDEKWSLDDITLHYIGVYDNGEIRLSKYARELFAALDLEELNLEENPYLKNIIKIKEILLKWAKNQKRNLSDKEWDMIYDTLESIGMKNNEIDNFIDAGTEARYKYLPRKERQESMQDFLVFLNQIDKLVS